MSHADPRAQVETNPVGSSSEAACEDEDERQERSSIAPHYKSKKEELASTLLNLNRFSDRLASIRSEIAVRNNAISQRQEYVSLSTDKQIRAAASLTSTAISHSANSVIKSTDRLKLPLLRHVARENGDESIYHTYLDREEIERRAHGRQQFISDAENLALAEQTAAKMVQNADRLAEETRIGMVMYQQSERSWGFEERAKRYNNVMEIKKQAELARIQADEELVKVRALRTQMADPYSDLRTAFPSSLASAKRAHGHTILNPMSIMPRSAPACKNFIRLWILASASPLLSFTPRVATMSSILNDEKELSTHIIYYAAASITEKLVSDRYTENEWNKLLADDSPPAIGWISCSPHGISPVPEVVSVKASIETLVVSGAGVGHLNGKYILSGVHDNTRRFKSSNGVEIFRKQVHVSSSLAQGLHDTPDQSFLDSGLYESSAAKQSSDNNSHVAMPLPSGLRAIEHDEDSFSSMSRIGAYLGMNEVSEKYRRCRENEEKKQTGDETVRNDLNKVKVIRADGDSVSTQNVPVNTDSSADIAFSRPDASAEICREWVLFMSCSRKIDKRLSHVANAPSVPKQIGLGCLKRHYYISFQEKQDMTTWARGEESKLEMNVLKVIIAREAHIDTVKSLCKKCMDKFQANLPVESHKVALKILNELNLMRFLSVKVLEAIDNWRNHARKLGFARYDSESSQSLSTSQSSENVNNEPHVLGWSVSISIATGKQLYPGSKEFVSKVKRFQRAEDAVGKKEEHIVYLGYFATKMEAEHAYDEYATAEARRLNTTVAHLPRRRNVFRSCGKHFAVESERSGPSFCIECKAKQLVSIPSGSSVDEWAPPFFYHPEENYILKMGSDLDFLDGIPPIKSILNDGHGGKEEEIFPMLGNLFLLPKTPLQDPLLADFTSFQSGRAPRLPITPHENDYLEEIIDGVSLDRDRILNVQKIFLQEMQMYHPELFPETSDLPVTSYRNSDDCNNDEDGPGSNQYRIIETLYWDRCAALKIQQHRPPLAFRENNVWCRPDAGEWSSLQVRGKHQQHFLFEKKLAVAGKEMQQRRQQMLKALRKLLKTPLYLISSRSAFTELISDGQAVKGDVVMLEVKSVIKYLDKYDAWCFNAAFVQRWFRGVCGRRRARAWRKAMHCAYKIRVFYASQIEMTSRQFYEHVVLRTAIRKVIKRISTPVFTKAININGELVIVSFHSLRFWSGRSHTETITPLLSGLSMQHVLRSSCCVSCARRFQTRMQYKCGESCYSVITGVCCCTLIGEVNQADGESWLLRAYNPINNVVYRLNMNASLLCQLVASPSSRGQQRNPKISCNVISERDLMHYNAVIASHRAHFYNRYAEKAHEDTQNWALLSSQAIQTRKQAFIALDKSTKVLLDVQNKYNVSIDDARKALDFSARRFHEAQAWDPLENANDWRKLVGKRRLEKDLKEADLYHEKCRLAFFQATYNEQFARVQFSQARGLYERYWRPIVDRERSRIENAATLETTTQLRMEAAMRDVCNRFVSIRDGCFMPTRRHLTLQSPSWRNWRPFRIAIPSLQRGRNVIRSRIVNLSSETKQRKHKQQRMIVSVTIWPTSHASALDSSGEWWLSAYDPASCGVEEVFLDSELVQLLVGVRSIKAFSDSKGQRMALRMIADELISRATLDSYTGEFTLQKLRFYHRMRLLQPQFLTSRWFRDLEKGIKCGHGDEVLRQVACIDSRICVVVIYENWGNLTLFIYHSASGRKYRVFISLQEVFNCLGTKPLMLRLWVCCVKSNNYTASILMQLLKYIRFVSCQDDHDGESDIAVFVPSAQGSTKTRMQKALSIQGRRVLVCVNEDVTGDWHVKAFDFVQNHTYELILERETLRRFLKTKQRVTKLRSPPLPSSSSIHLLLEKNRPQLFEWMCSRLRFQSLLEHPDVLSSAHSPLVFGTHIRFSFAIFNQWVSSSTRNPLQVVSEEEITQRIAQIDKAAFSQLQFDQLVLFASEKVPFDSGKTYMGTRDWAAAFRLSPEVLQFTKQSPHLKVDFFLKSHNLFARLRKELESEAELRKERESCVALELEERCSLCAEISYEIILAQDMLNHWTKCLNLLMGFLAEKITQWQEIHDEMRDKVSRTNRVSTGEKYEGASSCNILDRTIDIRTYSRSLFGSFDPTNSDMIDQVCVCIHHISSPLRVVSKICETGLYYVATRLVPTVSQFKTKLEDEVWVMSCSLDELRETWKDIQYLMDYFEDPSHRTVGEVGSPCHMVDETLEDEKPSAAAHQTVQDDAAETNTSDVNKINSGILIPPDTAEALQEIFIGDTLNYLKSDVMSSLKIDALLAFLKPLILPRVQARRNVQSVGVKLVVKRVPDGILVYQSTDSGDDKKRDWNPRAAALANEANISGTAIYLPIVSSASARLTNDFQVVAVIYHGLMQEYVAKVNLTSSQLRRRVNANRSKQLLPWKQFAGERLQAIRLLRLMRATEGQYLISGPNEAVIGETGNIATTMLSFRELEVLLGHAGQTFQENKHVLLNQLSTFLTLDSRTSYLGDDIGEWTMKIRQALRLGNVLATEDDEGVPIAIPSINRQDMLTMDTVEVEIDNVNHPRRLIFSCRELQSQQRYFVDCSYHQLAQIAKHSSMSTRLLHEEDPENQTWWPLPHLSIENWRQLAKVAATFLVFRKKNGTLALDFVPTMQPSTQEAASGPEEMSFVHENERALVLQPIEQPQLQSAENKEVCYRSQWRRFQKQQLPLRMIAMERMLMQQNMDMFSQRACEWMRMTQEDAKSHDNRGLLVLDVNVLRQLRSAWTSVRKRFNVETDQEIDALSVSGLVGKQLLEIGKIMGTSNELSGVTFVEVFQSVRESKCKRYGKRNDGADLVRSPVEFAEVVEWWRRYTLQSSAKQGK